MRLSMALRLRFATLSAFPQFCHEFMNSFLDFISYSFLFMIVFRWRNDIISCTDFQTLQQLGFTHLPEPLPSARILAFLNLYPPHNICPFSCCTVIFSIISFNLWNNWNVKNLNYKTTWKNGWYTTIWTVRAYVVHTYVYMHCICDHAILATPHWLGAFGSASLDAPHWMDAYGCDPLAGRIRYAQRGMRPVGLAHLDAPQLEAHHWLGAYVYLLLLGFSLLHFPK